MNDKDNAVQRLYNLYTKNGFVTSDEVYEICDELDISLFDTDYVMNKITNLGILVTDNAFLLAAANIVNGLIMHNPSDNVIIPKSPKKEMRVLSVEEEMRLLSVIHLHRLGFAIKFDLATGLRIGELCALKWTDLNYQKQTVKISRTLQRILLLHI